MRPRGGDGRYRLHRVLRMLAVLFLIPGQLYAGLACGCPAFSPEEALMDEELRHKDYLRDIDGDCDASFRGLLAGLLFSSAVWLLIIGLAAIARRIWSW